VRKWLTLSVAVLLLIGTAYILFRTPLTVYDKTPSRFLESRDGRVVALQETGPANLAIFDISDRKKKRRLSPERLDHLLDVIYSPKLSYALVVAENHPGQASYNKNPLADPGQPEGVPLYWLIRLSDASLSRLPDLVSPAWLDDDSLIYLAGSSDVHHEEGAESQLIQYDIGGATRPVLTLPSDAVPVPAPDGNRLIAFSAPEGLSQAPLTLYDLQGGSRSDIAPPATYTKARWEQGNLLLISRADGEDESTLLLDVSSRALKELPSFDIDLADWLNADTLITAFPREITQLNTQNGNREALKELNEEAAAEQRLVVRDPKSALFLSGGRVYHLRRPILELPF
jgi:hypothetical protein